MFTFFFNDSATTEIYTLSLHDALPICRVASGADLADHEGRFEIPHVAEKAFPVLLLRRRQAGVRAPDVRDVDRKSTRLNSSHVEISYAVFCLKKKITVFDTSSIRSIHN